MSKLTLKNGYYFDENNNSWSAEKYTLEEATEASATLVACVDCVDCRDCRACRACRACVGCGYCHYCVGCGYCRYCRDCRSCRDCRDCVGCLACRDCRSCVDCRACVGCGYCRDCRDLKNNPNRYGKQGLGGGHENTCAYWLSGDTDTLQLVCGCFNGTLKEFQDAVTEKYGSVHEYHDWIAEVLALVKG